jgi:hypothetical protein
MGTRQSLWLRTADGFAVLSRRCNQYKISKIKFAISMTAVTPAKERTRASLASL